MKEEIRGTTERIRRNIIEEYKKRKEKKRIKREGDEECRQ